MGYIKNTFVILAAILIVCFSVKDIQGKEDLDSTARLLERQSVTFILGDDIDSSNPFYRNAQQYFKYNDKDKTDLIVTSCNTLLDVQEYLLHQKKSTLVPWGKINMVSHGNQYIGLSTKVTPNSKRASADQILDCLDNNELYTLPKDIIDANTRIELHGCGLGNSLPLLSAFEMAFSNGTDCPEITASKYFEYFINTKESISSIEKFDADFKIVSFKMGYQPEDRILKKKFAKKYPDAKVDWTMALENKVGYESGDVFHFSFDVPLKWIFVFEEEEEVPVLKTKKARMEWAKQNEEIIQTLSKIEIQPDDFNWWMRNIYIENEDGTQSTALWVKGYSTVMCVLELLPNEQ